MQVAMVEVEISNHPPTGLLIPFAMNTAVLTFVHLFSLTIATRLLPELDAITLNNRPSQQYLNTTAAKLAKSWPVHMCWVLSNVVGIVLFIIEVILVAYVKFYPGEDGTDPRQLHVGTATLVVVVVLALVAVPFLIVLFLSVSKQKLQVHQQRLEKARELFENMNQPLHSAADAPAHIDRSVRESSGNVIEDSSIDSYHTSGSYEQLPRDTQV